MNKLNFINAHAAALAPMAGAAVSALRTLCMENGAAFSVSEMISAKAVTMGDKNTLRLLSRTGKETPFGVQIFGCEPDIMASAAQKLEQLAKPDFIDINMGCPAPKIVKGGAGSALMKNPALAAEIVQQVCAAVKVPVTVKLRAGFESVTAPQLAPLLERSGASAITLHPRTREQMFSGHAELSILAQVKKCVSIPVIGNGDICDAETALRMLEQTDCDMLMVGRAALGNPFVFAQIAAVLSGKSYTPPTAAERVAAMDAQIELMCEQMGEQHALPEARKHAMWYLKGFRGAAALRASAAGLSTMEQYREFSARALQLSLQADE